MTEARGFCCATLRFRTATQLAVTAATGMEPSPGGDGAGGGAALAADALANGFTARAFALRAHCQWGQADALEVRGGKLGSAYAALSARRHHPLVLGKPALIRTIRYSKKRREFPHLP